jgi:hypothetical protein
MAFPDLQAGAAPMPQVIAKIASPNVRLDFTLRSPTIRLRRNFAVVLSVINGFRKYVENLPAFEI